MQNGEHRAAYRQMVVEMIEIMTHRRYRDVSGGSGDSQMRSDGGERPDGGSEIETEYESSLGMPSGTEVGHRLRLLLFEHGYSEGVCSSAGSLSLDCRP